MGKTIQAIRGMNDILPEHTAAWQYLEQNVRHVLQSYGYQEIRLPIVEKTELFKRSIGEVTDIVEKEMYTFEDRNGDSLTLRPEGTAGCVRAGIEHGLLHNQQQRLWYTGPMFRHERPQKGRYRQFHQIGVEVFGMDGPDIDAELIFMTARFWRVLGIEDVRLQLNSLGTVDSRNRYRQVLVEYLQQYRNLMDEDSLRRMDTNPLRILDSKHPPLQEVIAQAPRFSEYLDDESRQHFDRLCTLLDAAGLEYEVNPRLVRGLDYYGRTVFEWVTGRLGAQGTVCAGGRYDALVEYLGGRPVAAVGFAMGVERLIALLDELGVVLPDQLPHLYLVMLGEQAEQQGILLAERLRDTVPGLRLLCNAGGGSAKSQFKRADKSGARMALVLGESELQQGVVVLKPLRGGEQQTIAESDLQEHLLSWIKQD